MPAFTPVIGDRYLFTYEELGKPANQGDVKVPGFGTILLDDADIHYAMTTPQAAFFVRASKALGTNNFVVVSRQRSA